MKPSGTVNKLGILFIILAAIIVSLSFFAFVRYNNDKSIITLHGNVDIREVDLGFRVQGRLIEMNFEEGDAVKKGEILAKLDKEPFEYDLQNKIAQWEQASANLSKLQTGNRPQEIQEAKALVREKEVNYENALKSAERQADLVKKNYTSKQAYDDAISEAKEAEAQLKTAKEALKLIEEGFRSEEIRVAKAQFEAAKSMVETAKIHLEDTQLKSPSDGILLTRIKEPGAILGVGDPVYTLSLTNPIWIRAYVSEINLGRIKPGMPVQVYTDTDPDKPYPGQIGFISPSAEFTPKNVETKELRTDLVYRVRITVNDPTGKLRQGMPVTVKIKVTEHNG